MISRYHLMFLSEDSSGQLTLPSPVTEGIRRGLLCVQPAAPRMYSLPCPCFLAPTGSSLEGVWGGYLFLISALAQIVYKIRPGFQCVFRPLFVRKHRIWLKCRLSTIPFRLDEGCHKAAFIPPRSPPRRAAYPQEYQGQWPHKGSCSHSKYSRSGAQWASRSPELRL